MVSWERLAQCLPSAGFSKCSLTHRPAVDCRNGRNIERFRPPEGAVCSPPPTHLNLARPCGLFVSQGVVAVTSCLL